MEADPDDALALLQRASLGGVVAVGPRAGCGVRGLHPARGGGRACRGSGERLARYVLRPPVGRDQIERRRDRVAVRLSTAPLAAGGGAGPASREARGGDTSAGTGVTRSPDGFACARCGEAMTWRAIVVGEPATGSILRSLARGVPRRG